MPADTTSTDPTRFDPTFVNRLLAAVTTGEDGIALLMRAEVVLAAAGGAQDLERRLLLAMLPAVLPSLAAGSPTPPRLRGALADLLDFGIGDRRACNAALVLLPGAEPSLLRCLARVAATLGAQSVAMELLLAVRERPLRAFDIAMVLRYATAAGYLHELAGRDGVTEWRVLVPELDRNSAELLLRVAAVREDVGLARAALVRLAVLNVPFDALALLRHLSTPADPLAPLAVAGIVRAALAPAGDDEVRPVLRPLRDSHRRAAIQAGRVALMAVDQMYAPERSKANGIVASLPAMLGQQAREALGHAPPAELDAALASLRALRLKLARAAYAAGDFTMVRRLLDAAAYAGTATVTETRFAILAAGKQHDYARGDTLLAQATASSPGDLNGLLDLAAIAWEAGRFTRSAEFLVRAQRMAAADPIVWRRIADHLLRRGDLAAAIGALHRAGPNAAGQTGKLRRIAASIGLAIAEAPVPEAALLEALDRPAAPWLGRVLAQLIAVAPRHPMPKAGAPPRIAVVGMHLGYGGAPQKAQRFARALKLALAHDGGEVVYACPLSQATDGSSAARLREVGVEVAVYAEGKEAPPFAPPAALEPLLALVEPAGRRARVLALAARLVDWRPHVLHAMGTNELILEAALAAALAGVPRVLLNPGMMRPERYAKKDQGIEEARLYRELFAAALADPARFALVNNSLVAAADYTDWIGAPPGSVGLLYNGINAEQALPERGTARAALGLAPGDEVVVVVGRIAHEKRPEIVLDAVERLALAHPALRLIFIGAGPLEGWLAEEVTRRGLGDRVRLAGYQSDVVPWYAAADLCLLVSEAEGLPNVVLEAQGLGLPVVATHAGGAREAMLPGITGLIVDRIDPDDLAAAVTRALEPRWRDRAARLARRRVAERFSMPAMVAGARALYAAGEGGAAMREAAMAMALARAGDLPFNPAAALARANALAARDLYGAAANLARAVLRRQPDHTQAWGLWSRMLRRLGRWDCVRHRLMAHLAARAAAGRLAPAAHRAILAAIGEDSAFLAALPAAEQDGAPARAAAERLALWSRLPGMPGGGRDGMTRYATSMLPRIAAAPPPRPTGAGARSIVVWVGDLGIGGGERQVLNLCRGLLMLTPHRLTLLAGAMPISGVAYDTGIADPRFAVLHGDALPADPAAGPLPAEQALGRLTAHFLREQPDVVHVRGVAENAATAAAAAVLAGVPRVIVNIGTLLPARQSDGSTSQEVANRSNLALLAALAARPQVLFAFNSVAAKRDWAPALGLPEPRARVVANGFEPDALAGAPTPEVAAALARLDALRAAGEEVVGGVFRFHQVKDPTLWIEVAARIGAARPQTRFVIAGDGRLRAHALALAEARGLGDRLILLGAVRSGLREVYARFDLLLIASRVESSPNVVIEGLSVGLPVVAPRVGGIAEAVPPSLAGSIVLPRTADRLAGAALAVLDDGALRASLRQVGPAFVASSFGALDLARAFADIYAEPG